MNINKFLQKSHKTAAIDTSVFVLLIYIYRDYFINK